LPWLPRTRALVRLLFSRHDAENELDTEVQSYFEILVARQVQNGVPVEEARRLIRLKFEGPERVKEKVREARTGARIASLAGEVKHAFRQLCRSPGFMVVAVTTLALGIGATTAIFSIVEGILLRPLPFRDPSRLVILSDHIRGVSVDEPGVNTSDIRIYTRSAGTFSSLSSYKTTLYELSGPSEPAEINATRLSGNTFQTLGVSPLLGRVFTKQEDDQKQQVTVLSYATWKVRFQSDPSIIGKKLLLDRQPYLIIGVMPRSFEFPSLSGHLNQSELWVPLSLTPAELTTGAGYWGYRMVGRLKSGITVVQAQADAEHVTGEIMRNYPSRLAAIHIDAIVRPLQEDTVDSARSLVNLLFLAALVLLLIACANLAGLLLVRAIRRSRESAVRLALGASAHVLIRHSLLETLILGLSGGLLGIAIAAISLRLFVRFLPSTLPRIDAIHLDPTVVGFALLLALVTCLLCGAAPAFATIGVNVNSALKAGARSGTVEGGHARLRSILVVAQIAIALVLLTASGLLLRSFQELRDVDLGYPTQNLLIANYSLPSQKYSSQTQVTDFNHDLLERLQRLPGTHAAALTSLLPINGAYGGTVVTPEGYVAPKSTEVNMALPVYIEGCYFQATGIPLLRGRAFTQDDNEKSQLVVIVNRKLAEHYWHGEDPIGKRLHVGTAADPNPWLTIIGEIPNVTQGGPEETQDHQEQYFQPLAQVNVNPGTKGRPTDITGNTMSVLVRTYPPPAAMETSIRAVFHSLDRQLAVDQLQSMSQAISVTEGPRIFNTAVITAFGVASVLLAILGVYSVLAFSVALRVQELAIRIALGSSRAAILRLILTAGFQLAIIGSVIGLLGAILTTRFLRSLLFEVSPLDPLVLAFSAGAVLLLTLAASVLPAMRATRVDPMQLLRPD
jgi:putative ABC transport system permease protein